MRILVGKLFVPVAFEGLRDNIIFLTSISSVGLRIKVYVNCGERIVKIIFSVSNRRLNVRNYVYKIFVKSIGSLAVQSNFDHYPKYWMELH